MSEAMANVNYLKAEGRFKGVLGWIFSTDHKRVGLLYAIATTVFFLVAMTLGLLIRLELIAPGETIMGPQTYNAMFTLHGMIMIFLFIIPGVPGIFGNFFLPILIGAKDVAFPRLNLLSWWIFMAGALLAVSSLFLGDGPPDTGWTFYVPYSIRTTTNVSLATFAAFILGFSSILTGLNFVVTVHRLRAPGMGFFRMPLFVWAIYATSWIQILATPVIGITLVMLIMERVFGIGVFDPAKGGDPIIYQHLFWIYSHPAVYIMILPGMGIVSEILPTFCRRTIFGYKAIAASSVLIALIGSLVWGHHMFTSGMSGTARWIFSLLTFFVAIPTAIKVFNWVATLYKGSIELAPPMLYAMSFIFLFSIGGLTGLVLGALATDIHLHDTSFVVAHFHYVMFGGGGMALFGGMHYWFPKMFGKMYNTKVATAAWTLLMVGFNTLYFPLFVIGFMGMPRRYYDYLPQFHVGHVVSTVGSWLLASAIVLMVGNFIKALLSGKPAPQNPWGGTTLEWQISTPPTVFNFDTIPTITEGPYEHSEVVKV